jgi:membrane-associated phospholipid phosphatase
MNSSFFIRLLADGLMIPIVLIGAFAMLRYVPAAERYQAYARIILAGLTAFLLAELVATMWQPDAARPFVELGVNPGASYLSNTGFPSDHVLLVSAITLAVGFETRKRKLTIFLAILTFLVALGRVLALVHTPLDVAGGVAFALLGATWYFTAPRYDRHTRK